MTDNERKAIVNLLDDPDESVYGLIREKILQSGCTILPDLEEAGATHPDPLVLKRADELVKYILFNQTAKEWKVWVRSPEKDLLTAAVLLAKCQYPSILAEDDIVRPIEKICRDVWLELNDEMTELEKILVLNKVMFAIHAFSVHPSPDSSQSHLFLNDLLKSGKGNSCTLAWLYMIVAHRNNIPVMGVDIRGRFVLCFPRKASGIPDSGQMEYPPVLFYISPLHNGAIYQCKDVDLLFLGKKNQLSPGNMSRLRHLNNYKPCGNDTFIANILHQYAFAFRKTGQPDKIKELNSLIHIITQKDKPATGAK